MSVGNNNLQAHNPGRLFRSEALLQKYRELIKTIKDKTANGLITGIIPTIWSANKIYSRAKYINRAVKKMAQENGLQYVDIETGFERTPNLFQADGRNLSARGITQLGRLLSSEVKKHYNSKLPGTDAKTSGNDNTQTTKEVP